MATIFDRIVGGVQGIAARVEAVARSARDPNQSRVVEGLPGVVRWGEPQRNRDSRIWEMLRSWGAYSGRVSPELGPQPTRYSLDPATDLTPDKIIDAQKQARQGYPLVWVELIDQLLSRDSHYMGVASQRVEDVIKGTKRLSRVSNDDIGTALRNFANEMYAQTSGWSDALGWLLWANAYCYNGIEVEWIEEEVTFPGPKGEIIGPFVAARPAKLYPVHAKHFRFDLLTDDPLLWLGMAGEPLPYGKFVFFDGEGLHPIKVRHGHAWQSVWYSMFRQIGLSSGAVHVDRFSLPVPIIEYDGDVAQYNEFKAAYVDILNSLGTGKGAILPRTGATFNIKDPPAGARQGDPAFNLIAACDTAQTIRVLGATLVNTSGPNGSYSGIEGHMDVKYAKEAQDARRLWERLDEQLTRPLIEFNAINLARALSEKGYDARPDMIIRRAPKGKQAVPRSDANMILEAADIAVNRLGMDVSREGLFDQIDLPKAIDLDDRIPGQATPVSKGGALVGAVQGSNEGVEIPDNEDNESGTPATPRAAPLADNGKLGTLPAPKTDEGDDDDDEAGAMRALSAWMSRADKVLESLKRFDQQFDESKHPRANDGKFGSKSRSGSSKAKSHTEDVREESHSGTDSEEDDDAPEITEAPVTWSPAKTNPVAKKEERDTKGRQLPGGSPGSQLPEDMLRVLKESGITKLPAAHISEVHVSDALHDPERRDSGALIKWKDDSGKVQSAYTAEFDRRNAEAKWKRIEEVRPKVTAMLDDLRSRAGTSPAHAAALLIAQTGLRPGSNESRNKHRHYGVTTMEARHVSFADGAAHIEYVGKEGVINRATVDDPTTVSALRKLTEGKDPHSPVFGIGRDKVAETLPEGVKVKDLRTVQATNHAESLLSGVQPPKLSDPPIRQEAKAVVKILKEVSTAVSKRLNNTPAMARRSYIAPKIIAEWGAKHGLPREWVE